MKKLLFTMIVLLALTGTVFAGVKDKALAPVTAIARYINKVAVGTNDTLSGAVGGFNTAAHGFAKDTNDFGKDVYTSLTGQKVD